MVQEQRSPVGFRVDESPTLDTLSPATGASPDSAHGRFLPGTIFGGRYRMIELTAAAAWARFTGPMTWKSDRQSP